MLSSIFSHNFLNLNGYPNFNIPFSPKKSVPIQTTTTRQTTTSRQTTSAPIVTTQSSNEQSVLGVTPPDDSNGFESQPAEASETSLPIPENLRGTWNHPDDDSFMIITENRIDNCFAGSFIRFIIDGNKYFINNIEYTGTVKNYNGTIVIEITFSPERYKLYMTFMNGNLKVSNDNSNFNEGGRGIFNFIAASETTPGIDIYNRSDTEFSVCPSQVTNDDTEQSEDAEATTSEPFTSVSRNNLAENFAETTTSTPSTSSTSSKSNCLKKLFNKNIILNIILVGFVIVLIYLLFKDRGTDMTLGGLNRGINKPVLILYGD